jgi:death-on-curing protein
LKTQDIINIHNTLIEKYGGTRGTMIEGTIDHLVSHKLNQSNTVFRNAAIALHTIATEHPFFDGNKRTAFELADVLLRDGGYKITADKESIKKMLVCVAEYKTSVGEIEEGIREYTAKS